MEHYPPQIEFRRNNELGFRPDFNQRPWFRSSRLVIFGLVFLGSATLGLIYNYSRPAIYRSSATLLTSAMTAIDRDSEAADIQHVVIQKQILLGSELVKELLLRLKASAANESLPQLTVSDVRAFLDVEPLAETNLVEMRAEGSDPEFLPVLINTWIDVYLDARKAEIINLTDNTTRVIEDELKGLNDKIKLARTQLQAFRENNDILSTGRDENEALARLKGLNDSLNRASEDEVKAKANLDAIKLAIANNQTVVPKQELGSLQNLEKRLEELREKLAELDKRFTRDYLNLQAKLKVIPEQIKKLELAIEEKRRYGRNIVLTDAENEYAAAQQTVKGIHAQLKEHKQQVARFTTKFSEHETLKTDLEGLEKLYRETNERLIQIETSQKEKYPQVTVIKQAYLSRDPLRPNYHRDAMIVLASSVLLGLFAVWIVEYLTRKQQQPSPITLSGIHLYQPTADMLNYQQSASRPLEQQQNNALDSPLYRELSSLQLRVLLNAASLQGKQLIGLLLSGLTLEEAARITAEQIDLERSVINVVEPVPRTLSLSPELKLLFEKSGGCPAWATDKAGVSDELVTSLLCAAIDSGLPNYAEINADAIRHSYILYLVRQGLRLSGLQDIVGYLAPTVISYYSAYLPSQKNRGIDEIVLLHPALIDLR